MVKSLEPSNGSLNEENDIEEIWNFSTPFQRTIYKRWDEIKIINNDQGEEKVIYGENVPDLWKKTLLWIEEHNLPLRQVIEEGLILAWGREHRKPLCTSHSTHP
jgi:hypothetical protein